MAKRISQILEPSDPQFFVQAERLSISNGRGGKRLNPWPKIYRYEEGVRHVIEEAKETGKLGLDLEFSTSTGRPSILGVASTSSCCSIPWASSMASDILSTNLQLVGHAVTDADRPILENYLGIKTPVRRWIDSMIKFYLCNSDFAAMPGKTEDDDDAGALGLMNLWTMASLYTDLPQWKICREELCPDDGEEPCPRHNVFGYCAVDAWAGLEADNSLDAEMDRRKIPIKIYDQLQDLTVYCSKMTAKGVKVDVQLVRQMEKDFEIRKQSLFPNEIQKKKKAFGKWGSPDEWGEILWEPNRFNPNSPKDIARYFGSVGISLPNKRGKIDTGKAGLQKVLDRQLRAYGLSYSRQAVGVVDDEGEEREDLDKILPVELRDLVLLTQYKDSGKGLKSWFDDRYIDSENFIHPRFIPTGTTTGRLSSSGPNFQNIPRTGFGANVRRAIIPRSSSLCLIKADYSQLELRVVLWYAGVREDLGGDAFSWLVSKADGKFKKPGERLNFSERDVAKSISHAGNYLEGITVLYDNDLRRERTQAAIKAGALVVFDGRNGQDAWSYRSGYVAFTGGNLGERLFGNKSFESRRQALEIQEIYFSRFPAIRQWHRSLSRQIESLGYVRSNTGRSIELYGSPEDDLKLAAAYLGQGGGAEIAQEAMLRYADYDEIATLQVHDELLFEKDKNWSDEEAVKFMSVMSEKSERFENFHCPIKVYRGFRWKEDKGNDLLDLHEVKL